MEKFSKIFIGSDIGNLLCLTANSKKQIHVLHSFEDGQSISSLNFGSTQNQILIGNVDNVLSLYDVDENCIVNSKKIPYGNGKIIGTFIRNEKFYCINESGFIVNVNDNHIDAFLKTSENLECYLELPVNENHIAVAGKNCQVTIFDIKQGKLIWKAKNPPNDELNLPIPIWISQMCYHSDMICTASRHGIVSVYDHRASIRPVLNWKDETLSFTTISKTFRERNCLLGTNKGSLRLFEFRKSVILDLNSYKGNIGSITDIKCDEFTSPLILTSSLDRNLNVFNLETKKHINQVILKEFA